MSEGAAHPQWQGSWELPIWNPELAEIHAGHCFALDPSAGHVSFPKKAFLPTLLESPSHTPFSGTVLAGYPELGNALTKPVMPNLSHI